MRRPSRSTSALWRSATLSDSLTARLDRLGPFKDRYDGIEAGLLFVGVTRIDDSRRVVPNILLGYVTKDLANGLSTPWIYLNKACPYSGGLQLIIVLHVRLSN